jgi:hypothetical protein
MMVGPAAAVVAWMSCGMVPSRRICITVTPPTFFSLLLSLSSSDLQKGTTVIRWQQVFSLEVTYDDDGTGHPLSAFQDEGLLDIGCSL